MDHLSHTEGGNLLIEEKKYPLEKLGTLEKKTYASGEESYVLSQGDDPWMDAEIAMHELKGRDGSPQKNYHILFPENFDNDKCKPKIKGNKRYVLMFQEPFAPQDRDTLPIQLGIVNESDGSRRLLDNYNHLRFRGNFDEYVEIIRIATGYLDTAIRQTQHAPLMPTDIKGFFQKMGRELHDKKRKTVRDADSPIKF